MVKTPDGWLRGIPTDLRGFYWFRSPFTLQIKPVLIRMGWVNDGNSEGIPEIWRGDFMPITFPSRPGSVCDHFRAQAGAAVGEWDGQSDADLQLLLYEKTGSDFWKPAEKK